MILPVCDRLPYRVGLFIPQTVSNDLMHIFHDPAITAEFIEPAPGVRRRNMEPFVPVFWIEEFISFVLRLQNALFPQICMKVRVTECIAGAIIKGSSALPFLLCFHTGSMRLLIDPLIHILFGITDLDVAIMI